MGGCNRAMKRTFGGGLLLSLERRGVALICMGSEVGLVVVVVAGEGAGSCQSMGGRCAGEGEDVVKMLGLGGTCFSTAAETHDVEVRMDG